MNSNYRYPLNIGSDRMVSVDKLADMIIGISGKRITKEYDKNKPQGVRGRNSDNSHLKRVLSWEPKISLEDGLRKTYVWIAAKVAKEKSACKKKSADWSDASYACLIRNYLLTAKLLTC